MARPLIRIPHVYEHADVSADLVSNFANASQDEQIRALRALRLRAEFHASEVLPAMLALSLSFTALLFSVVIGAGSQVGVFERLGASIPGPVLPVAPWVEVLVLFAFLLMAVLGWVWAAFVGVSAGREARARAAVWLRFYEDELRRRESARGPAARRWKSTHPINWVTVESPRVDEFAIHSMLSEQRRRNRARRRGDRRA